MTKELQEFLTSSDVNTEDYAIDKLNIIRSPGKFENEHAAVLYYYQAFLNGDGGDFNDDAADDPQTDSLVYNTTPTEREIFETDARFAVLYFSTIGFVTLRFIS